METFASLAAHLVLSRVRSAYSIRDDGMMSVYDLRSLFPYAGFEFPTPQGNWLCRLAEVSDLRPESDRLFWYLVFEHGSGWRGPRPGPRKLELVTTAEHLIASGFPPETESRLADWISGNEEDGRLEWLEF